MLDLTEPDQELLRALALDDPALLREAGERAALELTERGVFPTELLDALETSGPGLLREIGVQASLLYVEQRGALPPTYQPQPLAGGSFRPKAALPFVLLILVAIVGGMLFSTTHSAPAGIDSSTTGTTASTAPGATGESAQTVHVSGYTVTTGNELTAAQIDQLFAENGSPAVGDGQVVVDLGVKYGLDDIYFPAWYLKETSMGKYGVASVNNPTGMECSDLADGCTGPDGNGRNWGTWNSREAGFEAWFKQIAQRYVTGLIDQVCIRQTCHPGVRLVTVYLIACGPDGQGMYDGGPGCAGYAHDIEQIVDGWRARFVNKATGQPTGSPGASRTLVRISQLDPSQYNSTQEYQLWAYSACSAAAMTEVINAYGHRYRITDILQVEARIGEITPQLGLLEDVGIQRTAAQFHFTTSWGYNLTLDQVIALANQGKPVIVSFPPDRYAGGHLLVVIGGTSSEVSVADSSLWNRRTLSRSQFLSWWEGFSAIVTPS